MRQFINRLITRLTGSLRLPAGILTGSSDLVDPSDLRHRLAVLASAVLMISSPVGAGAASATLTVQAGQPGVTISSNLFGIFFEEISSAGDGGLYAELVRNRSFEDNSSNPDYWTLVTNGTATGAMSLDTSQPLSPSNLTSLRLTLTNGFGTVGAANSGYWGIPVTSGASYNLGFYARGSSNFQSSITVWLENSNGSILYAWSSVAGVTTGWQHFTVTLTPNTTDPAARLALRISQPGTVWLDFVSLFPAQTFHNRPNGLRPDLANMLADLRPSFVRFPGGAWVDGAGIPDFYNWEVTVGNPADRQPRWDLWGYMVDNGLGYHEYLQMCEDLGAVPLFAVNCGMDYSVAVPTNQLGPYIQEALDAIEYANGDTNSFWGAQRAANGHPAPFNLQYMEIGNENGGADYDTHYAMFYDAIKAQYPRMKLIATAVVSSRPMDVVDEHFYPDPTFFEQQSTRYNSYSRSGPRIFVGEYAVTSGSGNGNLAGALGEAAFMTGMERNSDVVIMACYAPLFANLNNKNWNPDLIYFTGTQAYGTPSYYVQQMFSLNRGDFVLPATVSAVTDATNSTVHGAVGLGSWNTSVQYTNIVVTSNGVTLYQSDFVANGTNGWRVYNGTWSTNAGLYQQTDLITDCRSTTGNTNWANYTLTLRARKVSGSEGFLILFNWLDDNNWAWWNIGGWGNTLDGIEQMSGGAKSLVGSQVSETIATGVWYDIRVVLTGPRIQCYLNGQLIQDVTYSGGGGLFASSSFDKAGGQIIVKAVNAYNQPVTTMFNLNGVDSISPTGTVIQLTSGSPADENSLAAPTKVFPVTNTISNAGTNFTVTLPANSISILRLSASGINYITNLLLQVPSPMYEGQFVASTVFGQQPGVTNLINLTTNPVYGITYSSVNTNIAAVDAGGHVTGVGSGTTSIVATYGSLGLSATQSVQVISVPTALVHRYSFSETGGTTVADSAGGPAWNGTLPNGGTFGGGQLALAAGSQQYVQLPGGILSNYTSVTIETWVTFPDQLPVNCFFYGFGNTNGNLGASYIFCAPQGGRIAITSGNYSSEQNAYGNFDFSYHTNFHVVAVYNPPAGYLALYTNGVLAAVNNAVTIPFSSVNNVYSYIARSLYSNDPYPDVNLDEFRIYNGALNADEIAATQALGPNQLLSVANPVVLASMSGGGNLTLSWPLASAGFTLESCTNLVSGVWTAVSPAPQIVAGQWQATVSPSGNARFFRLQK